ncbi:MAG: MarC family protein [Akkermansia sp.]|nr:MarC family protein [Akkermansia sp.]
MLDWNHIIAAAGTLFLVLDPPGNAPLVQSLLQQLPPEQRRNVLLRELAFVLLLLLLVFFLGKGFLGWLGISSSSLNLSGGIMLFIIAVGMVFPTKRSPHMNLSNSGLFIVPVTVPLIVGPAAISLVMMQAALCTSTLQKIEGLCAILVAWLASASFLCISGKILSLLGEKGTTALTRLMGTLLILLAVQMVLNGITEYIRTLPQHLL